MALNRLILVPPKQALLLSTLILFGLVVLSVWVMWRTPWMGIELFPAPSGTVLIQAVAGPAGKAGLKAGEMVRALRTASGDEVPVTPDDLLEEPDFHTEYVDYNNFLHQQQVLSKVLVSGRAGVVTDDGKAIWVVPDKRPVQDLPPIFWFQIACGVIAWLVGTSVFAYRQTDTAAKLYALTGGAFALVTFSAAIYSGRELALDGALFRSLAILNHTGAFLFAAAFVSLLWIYPSRLGGPGIIRLIFGLYLAVWVADTTQWAGDMDFGIRYPILAGLLASFVFGAMQWRNSRNDPIDRAALKWFLLTLLVGSAVFVFGVFGMEAAGYMPVIPQGYSFGMVLMMYLGMALGMKRYRLFNLEPWWPEVWLWLLGGMLVVTFDLGLVQILTRNSDLAFTLSLALAGWIYFPLRQWLLKRVGYVRDGRLSTLIPDLLEIAATPLPVAELQDRWHQLLSRAYAPQSLDQGSLAVGEAKVVENGLRLIVPGLGESAALILGYADGGKRLFLHADAQLAQALWELLSQVLSRQDAYMRGAWEERERIAKDLHDDIGAKLLTLIHRSESVQSTDLLRTVMQDLRSLAASLDRQPAPLTDALGDWRAEIENRCEAAGVTLVWRDSLPDSQHIISPRIRLSLERVLREAITNALKHAQPGQITVSVSEQGNDLLMLVQDDGTSSLQIEPSAGRGMRNMVSRMAEAGGSVVFKPAVPRGSTVEIRLPFSKLKG
jgi:signal transduction histidine kinase